MIDDIEAFILSYFKPINNNEYFFPDLREILGIPMQDLISKIEELLNGGYLEYKDYLLTLTQKGRVTILNSHSDFVDFKAVDIPIALKKIDPSKAMPLDKPYVPKDFLDKV